MTDVSSSTQDASADSGWSVAVLPLETTDLVRFPDRGSGGWQAALDAANQRRLTDARAALELRFTPVSALLERTGAGASVTLDAVGMPSPVAIEELVDSLLLHEDLRPPHLSFDVSGTDLHDTMDMRTGYDMFRADVPGFAAKLQGGARALIRWIDDYVPELSSICAALETTTGVNARVELLIFEAGPVPVPGSPGAEDRVVVPVGTTLAVTAPAVGDLPPGRALVVPAGTVPELTAAGSGFLLVFDIGRAFDAMLIDIAARDARYYPLLRADLPAVLDAPATSYAGHLYDRPGAFGEHLAEAMGPVAFERASAWARAGLVGRPQQRLSDVLVEEFDPGTELRCPLQGGLMVAANGDDWTLAAGGVRILLDPDRLDAIVARLDGRTFVLADLVVDLGGTWDEAHGLARHLIELEILDVVGA